jgi:hypothetical protein
MTAAAGSGVSYASEGKPEEMPESSMSADGQFFKPGPTTIVKVTAGQTDSKGKKNERVLGVSPAPAEATAFRFIKNARRVGQSCGTNVIQQTSGQGKTTLVLTVDKKVDSTVKKEISVGLGSISAGVGWDVTKSYGVSNQTRYEVPRGKFGTVQAFPLYEQYIGEVWEGVSGAFPTGKRVFAYKPVGVCFNQWLR